MGRLYLRVVHGGSSASVTTDYRVWAREWDPVGRQLRIPRGGTPRAHELLEYQRSMHEDMRRLESVVNELERRGPYTAGDVTARYRSLTGWGLSARMLWKGLLSAPCPAWRRKPGNRFLP